MITRIYHTIFISLIVGITMAGGQTIPPATNNPCIGQQGQLNWFYWNDIELTTLDHLYARTTYPQGPDGSAKVKQAATPYRFNERFGGVFNGYFTVPETGLYQFNLTADDRGRFYMSPDDNPANMVQVIDLSDNTGQFEHYLLPEQTTEDINLQADTYYYFEVHYKEATGTDFAYLHWHTPSMADSSWQILPVNHIYESVCDIKCPPAGTACDDGNSNSVNDQEDGACNCYGQEESALGCVGEQGRIQVMTWLNVPGSGLSNLYNLPTFPLIPDTIEFLELYNHFGQYNAISGGDNIGKVIKAYLSVPQTGEYQFNITADDRGKLFLSTDEEVFNAQEVAYTVSGNSTFQHDEHPEQTSAPVQLVAGQYYYLEFHFKENSNTARYHLYWKTPFSQDEKWKVVPLRYLYNYDCETACLPNGTACDDKDSGTYNDVVTACACAGIPCPGGDCTELETYFPYEECAYTNEHTNTPNNSWLSCSPSENPNPARGVSHWISYDFGQVYQINGSMIWNYNVAGNTGAGFKDMVVDYSIDGVSWIQLGSYQMPEASGASNYGGVIGPDLDGIGARYILITALTTWENGACAGISEVQFEAQECPEKGTLCDDGDPTTEGDMFDAYCQCKGLGIPANDCAVDSLEIVHDPAFSQTYSAIKYIESSKLVSAGSNVSFIAGEEIDLKVDFEVELGSNFLAAIIPCQASVVAARVSDNYKETSKPLGNPEELEFFTHKDPNTNLVYMRFQKKGMSSLLLSIADYSGNEVAAQYLENLNDKFEEKFDFGYLEGGVYNISVQVDGQVYTERLILGACRRKP